MVTSTPPKRCGIASYAVQSVKQLKWEGNIVDVLTFPGGEGDFIEDLRGGNRLEVLLKYQKAYDKIIVQYCPDFFFIPYDQKAARSENLKACRTMRKVFKKCGKISVICHEEFYHNPQTIGRIMSRAERIKWDGVKEIFFHTEIELKRFANAYCWSEDDKRLKIKIHHEDFIEQLKITKKEARKLCGWPEDKVIFLSLGFIQSHKGFDRGIKAFSTVPQGECLLYIVGSLRYEDEETRAYLELLKKMAEKTPGVFFENKYIPDKVFDALILGADYLLLPYRKIWSSSVVARAKLFETPVIATNVGGLEEQLEPGDYLVSSDEELKVVLQNLCRGGLKIISAEDGIELREGSNRIRIKPKMFDSITEEIQKWRRERKD